MTETVPREIDCVLCEETYTPALGPEEGEKNYRIYCSSCVNWVAIGRSNPLRIALREVLEIRGEALALAVQTCLASCRCGSGYNHDAGGRCPTCIEKIERETKDEPPDSNNFKSPWKQEEMEKLEPKFLEYILNKTEHKELNLNQLIEKFEAGEIGAEEYMEGIESIQGRESNQVAVVEAWAMTMDPDEVFEAVEEHELVERYGTHILVNIASALESNTGRSVMTTLSKEMNQFDEIVQKELKTFLAKIGGGF